LRGVESARSDNNVCAKKLKMRNHARFGSFGCVTQAITTLWMSTNNAHIISPGDIVEAEVVVLLKDPTENVTSTLTHRGGHPHSNEDAIGQGCITPKSKRIAAESGRAVMEAMAGHLRMPRE
jgi:hypothetical protein